MQPHPFTAKEKAGGYLPPPDGPVDFGATNVYRLWFSYEGIHD
jgi:hypothetical protein